VERVRIADLGIAPEDLEPRTEIVEQVVRPARQAGKILDGDAADQAKELARLLRQEAKVV